MIKVRGAREHNLKNIDVDLPRDELIVISGLSGSGKSSLAFDTIYAEGQRRYVESLSAYARQFLDRMGKPDVDSIEGLSPAISIDQKTTSRNPRSTVGTVTEIHDYLRLLFARVGTPFCPNDGEPIKPMSVQQIVEAIFQTRMDQRARVLAPLVRRRKGTHKKLLLELARQGFVRVIVDGEEHFLEELQDLEKSVPHDITLVVDRIVVRENDRQRIRESIATALSKAEGYVELDWVDDGVIEGFSERNACVACGEAFPELSPQLFSFNSPIGACTVCEGIGSSVSFDEDLIVSDPELSVEEGAIRVMGFGGDGMWKHILRSVADHVGFDLNTPYGELDPAHRNALMHGTTEPVEFVLKSKNRSSTYTYTKPFEGIIPMLQRRLRESTSNRVKAELEKYMRSSQCPGCEGERLNRFARAVQVSSHTFSNMVEMELGFLSDELAKFSFTEREQTIAEKIMREISERVHFLNHVGLDYLTLPRSAHTLSGGEAQRIRLATQIGSKLVGVLYVLDEPSIGLHQADQAKLIETLNALRDLGNTVIVVEHDEDTILSADYVVDLGPKAGTLGGEVIAVGTPQQIAANPASVTGQYLASKEVLERKEAMQEPRQFLTITDCSLNNLQHVTLEVPLGRMVSVTGVSGSGKSSLVMDTLYPVMANRLHKARRKAGPFGEIKGLDQVEKVLEIDQTPIGRTPRSNPATYSGVFTEIRELFSMVPEARSRGYTPGRFSFNVKGGRCEACEGDGYTKIEMHFLPDVYVKCDLCQGARYNTETLEIRYKGATIVDVLNMDVQTALEFFQSIPKLKRRLQTLVDVGLGYVKLGQSATTLSGGEAQRLKLSKELSRKHSDHTLYILDEPTTGLHFDDVARLIEVLRSLVDSGNSVMVIEHNLDLIAASDWLIDLGPAGGHRGGSIIAHGHPRDVAESGEGYTAEFLAQYYQRKREKNGK